MTRRQLLAYTALAPIAAKVSARETIQQQVIRRGFTLEQMHMIHAETTAAMATCLRNPYLTDEYRAGLEAYIRDCGGHVHTGI